MTARTAAAILLVVAAAATATASPAQATLTSTRFRVDCTSTSAMAASPDKATGHSTMVWSCGQPAPTGTRYAYVYAGTVAAYHFTGPHGETEVGTLGHGWHRVIVTRTYHVT